MLNVSQVLRIPRRQGAEIDLPAELEGLYELAYNLWWTWSLEARQLFSAIDAPSWARYHNPVELLLSVDRPLWEQLLESDHFMAGYAAVERSFAAYLGAEDTWFDRRLPDYEGGPVAYFSMEYGVHQSLAVYSGGLGVLSGDHAKTASDLGIPFVAVGLLYRRGYFRQTLDPDGLQQHTYPEYDFHRLPLRPVASKTGGDLLVRVPFPGREVAAKVWLAQVGRVPLLLLDTDISQNDPADRPITLTLYVGGREMRLAQELVLGVGGVKALASLAIEPAVWHLNEGHSALLQLERLRRRMEKGEAFEEALAALGDDVVFTTHTPVPAGNEQFESELASRHLEPWSGLLGVPTARLQALGAAAAEVGPAPAFNLTALALRTSRFRNGVSQANAEVVDRMWRHLFPAEPPDRSIIAAITNGVHLPTWLGPEMRSLLTQHLPGGWEGEGADWSAVAEIPDADLWAAHVAQKERLRRFIRARLREQAARHGHSPEELREVAELFRTEALTIGFARRFATYKRAGLIFGDLERLRRLLEDGDRPVQVVFSGKAHPADRPGQELIESIFRLAQGPLRGKIFFLENYDMRLARMLVQGVDVWLNTPRRPLEASGTSGMKAAVNGVLNVSVLDGWWPEAYDGENGWGISSGVGKPEGEQDGADMADLYRILESEVAPEFYRRSPDGVPAVWLARMKRSIASIAPRFAASRMVREYADRAYIPLATRRR